MIIVPAVSGSDTTESKYTHLAFIENSRVQPACPGHCDWHACRDCHGRHVCPATEWDLADPGAVAGFWKEGSA